MLKKLDKLRKNDFWGKLIRNVSLLFCGSSVTSILNFGTTLIILKSISTIEYAYFAVAQQYMNVLDALLNFQSWQSVIKYGSEALYAKQQEKLKAVIKGGYTVDILSAVAGTIIAFLIIPFIGRILEWNETIILLCRLFCWEIIFHIEGSSIGILRLYDKFNLMAIENSLTSLIQLIAIGIYYLLGGGSLITIAVIYIVFDIVFRLGLFFIALCVVHQEIGIKSIVQTRYNVVEKGFYKYTMWSNVGRTADIPVGYFDVFIIGTLSYELISIYKIFKQIIQVISKLTNPISAAILPQFSVLIAQGKAEDGFRKVIKLRNIILLLMTFFIILAVCFGKPFFNMLLGDEYGQHIIMFIIMSAVYGVSFAYVAIHPYFAAIGKVKEDFLISIVANIIYCIVIFSLLNYLDVYAIIIGTSMQFLVVFVSKTVIIKRFLAPVVAR